MRQSWLSAAVKGSGVMAPSSLICIARSVVSMVILTYALPGVPPALFSGVIIQRCWSCRRYAAIRTPCGLAGQVVGRVDDSATGVGGEKDGRFVARVAPPPPPAPPKPPLPP